jgi:hypothetical protein
MRLPALTIAVATALTFALPHTPVTAQGHDDGAIGRPLQLDGGQSPGSDNRGQIGSRSEATEPSAGTTTTSKTSQTGIAKTGETAIRARSKTHIGWRSRPGRRFAIHNHSHHLFAFHMPRHRFVVRRHGRRFVAFDEPTGV